MNRNISNFAIVSILLGIIVLSQAAFADEVTATKPRLDTGTGGWHVDLIVNNTDDVGVTGEGEFIYDFHVRMLSEGVSIIGVSSPKTWNKIIARDNLSATFNTSDDPIKIDKGKTKERFDIITNSPDQYRIEWFTTNITGHTIDNGTLTTQGARKR